LSQERERQDLTRMNHDHYDDADWLRRQWRSLSPGSRSRALSKPTNEAPAAVMVGCFRNKSAKSL